MQEHHECRLEDHRRGGPVLGSQVVRREAQLRGDRELHPATAEGLHRGAGTVERKRKAFRDLGEFFSPVGELPVQDASRLVLVPQHVPLPQV